MTRKGSMGGGGQQLDLRRSYLSVGADVRRGKAMKIVFRRTFCGQGLLSWLCC